MMTKKEILLNALGEEKGGLAICEIDKQRGTQFLESKSNEKASSILSGSFNWKNSTQGKEYWEKIQRELYSIEEK